jgi:hypothetical protein
MTHAHSPELSYRVNSGDDDWEPINKRIWFDIREQLFGGLHKFFTCTGCRRSRIVLYGGKYFRCRKCYNLCYASENGDYLDHLRAKGEALETRFDAVLAFHMARLTGLSG